ncbi:MAG: DUF3311 domain-containing protein [Phycisphaeraceae bacterium]
MKNKWIWIIFVVLFFLHQDVWFWDDQSLVLGFMPIGLAYHAGFSIAAALLWASAVKWAWPSDVEAWAEGDESEVEG